MKRTRATTTAFGLALSLALALTAFASAGTADGPAPTFELSLAPKPVVTAGETALARAELENVTGKPLAQVEITFDLPAGSFESASPEGRCVLKRTQVSCAIGKVPAGGVVEQFIMLTVPADVEEVAVAAEAKFKKSGRAGSTTASDSTGVVAAGDPDAKGTCASEGGTLATDPASGEENPQSTSATFTASRDLPCTPISVGEQEPTPANPGCPEGVTCTTQVSFVTVPALPEPAIVTLTFDRSILAPGTKPKNFVLWETPDKFPAQPIRKVQACPLPPGEDSCIVEVTKHRKKGIQVVLQVVGSGEDPRYRG